MGNIVENFLVFLKNRGKVMQGLMIDNGEEKQYYGINYLKKMIMYISFQLLQDIIIQQKDQ